MDNKKTKYLLGILLIIIWGLVCYRIYQRVQPNRDAIIYQPSTIANASDAPLLDSFELLLDYRDPFFKTTARRTHRSPKLTESPKVSNNTSKKRAAPKKKSKPKPIEFPPISYKGTVQVKNKKAVALLSINQQMVNLQEGEKFEEVVLQKIYTDSIRISFQKEIRTILKIK